MNRNLLMILAAGVDVWAILFVLQRQTAIPWEVSLTISGDQAVSAILPDASDPVQVCVSKSGVSLMPDQTGVSGLPAVENYLKQYREEHEFLSVRILCDPGLTLKEWGPVAVELSEFADDMSIAPALQTSTR